MSGEKCVRCPRRRAESIFCDHSMALGIMVDLLGIGNDACLVFLTTNRGLNEWVKRGLGLVYSHVPARWLIYRLGASGFGHKWINSDARL